jgi:hypothetical protein
LVALVGGFFVLVYPEKFVDFRPHSYGNFLFSADIVLGTLFAKFYRRAAMFSLALFLIIERIEPVGNNFF